MTDIRQSLSITDFARIGQRNATTFLLSGLSRFARVLFLAMHESRRRQAEAELQRHRHLVRDDEVLR